MFKNAKEGDKVWSMKFGWGVITVMMSNPSIVRPIGVDFIEHDPCTLWYHADGKCASTDILPSIFWNDFKIPAEAYLKPLPKLAVDTKVIVWDKDENTRYKRYFHSFATNGSIRVFSDGRSSFTAYSYDDLDYYTTTYLNYEVVNDIKEISK